MFFFEPEKRFRIARIIVMVNPVIGGYYVEGARFNKSIIVSLMLVQFIFKIVNFNMHLKMTKFYYFESKFHYLKVTYTVENTKNSLF